MSEEAYQWRDTDLYRLCNIHPNCHILSHICRAFYAKQLLGTERKGSLRPKASLIYPKW